MQLKAQHSKFSKSVAYFRELLEFIRRVVEGQVGAAE